MKLCHQIVYTEECSSYSSPFLSFTYKINNIDIW